MSRHDKDHAGYSRAANGSGGQDLILQRVSSLNTLRIRNWSISNNVGVTLNETAVSPPTPSLFAGTGSLDLLTGSSGADLIQGLAGNDGLAGGFGDDVIEGGEGADLMLGGAGRDDIQGGAGDDLIFGSGVGELDYRPSSQTTPPAAQGPEIARGLSWVAYEDPTPGADGRTRYHIVGANPFAVAGDQGNVIDGGAGCDRIVAGTGADVVHGGLDDDQITGLHGGDRLFGDAGNDLILGDGVQGAYVEYTPLSAHGNDVLVGGAGNDDLIGQGGDDVLEGGDDDDVLIGDQLRSGAIDDTPAAYHGDDHLDGGNGRDDLQGTGGADTLYGGAGDDKLFGDASGDRLEGQHHANDYLDGQGDNDYLEGGGADDVLLGGAGNDVMWGDGDPVKLAGLYHGEDYLDGENGDDRLVGGGKNDTLFGGTGADVLLGDGDGALPGSEHGQDYLDGEDGDDILEGGGANDVLYGGTGIDVLRGDADLETLAANHHGNDLLDGGDGNDSLIGDGGSDVLAGGEGDDVLRGDANEAGLELGANGRDHLNGGSGADQLVGGGNDDVLLGGTGNDTLFGDDETGVVVGVAHGADYLDGGEGDDFLAGQGGNDTLIGGSGVDYLKGDDEASVVAAEFHGADHMDGGASDDTLLGGAGSDTLIGGDGNDWLAGEDQLSTGAESALSGDDFLDGGIGDDVLIGGNGVDVLNGGAGNDGLLGGSGQDTYVFGLGDGTDTIVDEDANNTIRFGAGISPGMLTVQLAWSGVSDGMGDAYLQIGYGGTDTVHIKDGFVAGAQRYQFADGTVWSRADILALLASPLVFTGSNKAESIYGGSGSDNIRGGSGDDVLYGGAGFDVLAGGIGNDVIDAGLDGGSVQGDEGSDVYLFGRDDGSVSIDTFSTDWLSATEVVRFKSGIAPTDIAVNRVGLDLRLSIIGSTDELVIRAYYASADASHRVARVEFSDGSVWNRSTLEQRAAPEGAGSGPSLYGTHGADVMNGGDGNDYVNGLEGDDQLFGRGGNDYVVGGDGDDDLYGEVGEDSLVGGFGSDRLEGGSQDDLLDGGAGRDVLYGGDGNDTYLFGTHSGYDRIVEQSGTDRIVIGAGISAANVHLFQDGSVLRLVLPERPAQLEILGSIERIDFDDGSSWNIAAIQAHTIAGIQNNMVGTAGDNLFIVDHSADAISEALNSGIDSVHSSVSYTLGINIENITLTGQANLNATGNELNNILVGNSGSNTFNGAASARWSSGGPFSPYDQGADTMIGGTGDDYYFVDEPTPRNYSEQGHSDDVVVELTNEGIDTAVVSSFYFTLPDNVENLVAEPIFSWWTNHAGEASRFLAGNDLDNTIDGRQSYMKVYIDGGAGADSMYGTKNDDEYVIDQIGDQVFDSGGIDTIRSSVSYTLQSNMENLVLAGTNPISGTGNSANNKIDGLFNSAANVLAGKLGDDIYRIGLNDIVVEEINGGYDTIYPTNSFARFDFSLPANVENIELDATTYDSNVHGNAENNQITGNKYANILNGGEGDDVIRDGGTLPAWPEHIVDHDQLFGGPGDDTLYSEYGFDLIDGDVGNDKLFIRENYFFPDRPQNRSAMLAFGYGDGRDIVESDFFIRLLFDEGVAPSDIHVARQGTDFVIGLGAGPDSINFKNFFSDEASDVIRHGMTAVFADSTELTAEFLVQRLRNANSSIGSSANDALVGSAGADEIQGFDGQDSLLGLAGDDVLEGGAGDDWLRGGGGQDVLAGGTGADLVDGEAGTDVIRFGRGDGQDLVITDNDTLVFLPDVSPADVVVTREDGHLVLTIAGTSDAVTVKEFLEGNRSLTVSFHDGTVWESTTLFDQGITTKGTSGNDVLEGWDRTDRLLGLAGNDTLIGRHGDDLLDGGAGIDSLKGGYGDDQYWVDNSGDVLTELVDDGWDKVWSSINYTLRSNFEALELIGSANINATGNSLDNELLGNAGNNVLNGGSGADYMAAGLGTDTYVVDANGDQVVELAGGGTDLVQSSITYTLGVNVENLTLTGSSASSGTGNVLNNTLTGNAASNTLTGGDGDDTLNGKAGADILVGGTGSDAYVVDNAGDVVTELTNEGVDVVSSSVSYTLHGNVENLMLTGTVAINGTGNALDNTLIGNSANNTLTGGAGSDMLDGGAGSDSMIGGTGNDSYVVNVSTDAVAEAAEEGADIVRSSVTFTLGMNVENLTLTGTSAINGTGNMLDNVLNGNSRNNTLTGNAGNDTLDGGLGTDTLRGGTGNDIYFVNAAADVVTENANEGTDTVNSAVTLSLGSNLENLTLTGTAAINGTGNAFGNVLTGNSATNTLAGAAGDDIYIGGQGNDILTDSSTTSADVYRLGRGDGADRVTDSGGAGDRIELGAGVSIDQLWFRRVGSDLEVSIIGTGDRMQVASWYSNANYRVEQIRTSGGQMLLDSKVQNLVDAMASFAPPATGQTTLPSSYQSALASTITANWQPGA